MKAPADKLRAEVERAIARARNAGLLIAEILEAVDDARWALVGDQFRIDHYGGADQVPSPWCRGYHGCGSCDGPCSAVEAWQTDGGR